MLEKVPPMDVKKKIPQEIRKEIESFAAEVERRSRENIDENGFKHFRLQQGVYGQRQSGDIQMIRTKLPLGQINSEKLNCLAEFGDKYANGVLHITTRQDVQFHFVDLEKVPEGLELLAEGGITTREACGNTVRNITACHKSGTCTNEALLSRISNLRGITSLVEPQIVKPLSRCYNLKPLIQTSINLKLFLKCCEFLA